MRPKALLPAVLVALTAARVSAQTIEDSVMMRRNSLCTAVLYSNDRWESYWEGPLKRVNGNIGRITTQSVSGMVDYGVTDRLNVIAALPYVWTRASQGVLHGVSGWQDLTVAAKFNLLETDFTHSGSLRTIVAVAAGTPIGDYTPDYYPLSLGSASRRLSGRLTMSFRAKRGWFLDATSERSLVLRRHEGRSGHLAPLRGHPLPVGHRGRQGPRQAYRRLHRQLREAGRRELRTLSVRAAVFMPRLLL